jgi:N-acetylglucosaminyl-diphospho-decaprenol L-rhamnosyltransferase
MTDTTTPSPTADAPDPAAAELAVVIVNYNTGEYLERCLRSLEQHRGDIETDVVVVDNASHDGSHTRAVAAHPWARLIENPTNVFLSPAWNQGIRETKAPWILLLNPDTEWWRGTLSGFVEIARAHPAVGIVGPMVRNSDGTIYPSGRPFPSVTDAMGHAFLGTVAPGNRFTRRYHLDDWERITEREVDWVSGCCMLVPREALDQIGGLDERFPLYGEELDLATRLRAADRTVLYTPAVEIVHEVGVSTGRGRRMLVTHSNSIYRYYRLHRASGWRRLSLPIAWIVLRVRAELEWLHGRLAGR